MTVLAIAHRAGNSLESLRTAMELGADVVEADVHQHRGQLEVRHLKTMGPLPFLWDKWELVPASVPRLGLAELLRAADTSLFMLDIKGRRGAAALHVASTLHEHAPGRPVLVCSRYWPALDSFARLPWTRTVPSARNRAELFRLRARVRGALPPYGVSVHRSLLDRRTVFELRERVEVVMTWPVDDESALHAVLRLGVTGVISDKPDVLRELIDRRE